MQSIAATGEPWRFGCVIVSGGSTWGNTARCDIGGASDLNRALTDEEILMLSDGTRPSRQLSTRERYR